MAEAVSSLKKQPNRNLAQNLIDLAGPADAGLINCEPLHNGWIYSNLLSGKNREAMRLVHELLWGPKPSSPRSRGGNRRNMEEAFDHSLDK